MIQSKKIFQIAVEVNTGSTGTIAESIGKLVIKQGWKSYIAYGRYACPSNSEVIKISSAFDVALHVMATRLFDRHGMGSKNTTKKLISKIDKIKPDIIHLHHLHGYYINIELLFEYLHYSKIPVVWTFHDCWSVTGHCCYFDDIGCDKWKNECSNCPQLNDYPASLIFDRSKKNYYLKKTLFNKVQNLTIVSVSNWLKSIVDQSFLKNAAGTVIYNGVDVNTFKPLESITKTIDNNYNNKFVILGVASPWSKRKGFADFIKFSNLLCDDELIVLVGLDKKLLKNLPHNIHGISRIEGKEELVKLYNRANVYVNLSVEETFGLTTAEALACGTPAIVYNSTAGPELLDEDTGFVIPKRDILRLRRAVSIIKENGKELYSAKCRARALKLFDESEKFGEYINLYKSLFKGNSNDV